MEFTQMTGVNVTSYTNHNINQRGSDTINAVSMVKCQKYPLK